MISKLSENVSKVEPCHSRPSKRSSLELDHASSIGVEQHWLAVVRRNKVAAEEDPGSMSNQISAVDEKSNWIVTSACWTSIDISCVKSTETAHATMKAVADVCSRLQSSASRSMCLPPASVNRLGVGAACLRGFRDAANAWTFAQHNSRLLVPRARTPHSKAAEPSHAFWGNCVDLVKKKLG